VEKIIGNGAGLGVIFTTVSLFSVYMKHTIVRVYWQSAN